MTSPDIAGADIGDAWAAQLTDAGRYRLLTPSELVPVTVGPRWREWRTWLATRYGT